MNQLYIYKVEKPDYPGDSMDLSCTVVIDQKKPHYFEGIDKIIDLKAYFVRMIWRRGFREYPALGTESYEALLLLFKLYYHVWPLHQSPDGSQLGVGKHGDLLIQDVVTGRYAFAYIPRSVGRPKDELTSVVKRDIEAINNYHRGECYSYEIPDMGLSNSVFYGSDHATSGLYAAAYKSNSNRSFDSVKFIEKKLETVITEVQDFTEHFDYLISRL